MTDVVEKRATAGHTHLMNAYQVLVKQAEEQQLDQLLLMGVLTHAIQRVQNQERIIRAQDRSIEAMTQSIATQKEINDTLNDTIETLIKIKESQDEEIDWLKASWWNRRTARKSKE